MITTLLRNLANALTKINAFFDHSRHEQVGKQTGDIPRVKEVHFHLELGQLHVLLEQNIVARIQIRTPFRAEVLSTSLEVLLAQIERRSEHRGGGSITTFLSPGVSVSTYRQVVVLRAGGEIHIAKTVDQIERLVVNLNTILDELKPKSQEDQGWSVIRPGMNTATFTNRGREH